MYRPLLVAASLALVGAACSPYDEVGPGASRTTTQYVVMTPPSPSAHVCIDYGFVYGTSAYDRCVSRVAYSRSLGRMGSDYAMSRIEADASDACLSYGLYAGSARYDRCVALEIDARRYRAEGYVVTTAPAPVQYVYTPRGYDQRVATTGVEVFRDEYGHRYDSQGNRLDRFGNIISPHTRGQ